MASALTHLSGQVQTWDALNAESLLYRSPDLSLTQYPAQNQLWDEQPWGHCDFNTEFTQIVALSILQSTPIYACRCCENVFKAKHTLVKHIRDHHGMDQLMMRTDLKEPEIGRHNCPEENCFSSYAIRSSLKSHYRREHGKELDPITSKFDKKFPCPHVDCPIGLKALTSLKSHLKHVHGEN